jgi:hypothetical protein
VRRAYILLIAILAATTALPAAALADDDESSIAAFQALMTNQGEVPPTPSAGRGLASLVLSADGSTLYYNVSITGMSSSVTAAHIHLGPRGQNGEVVVNFCGAGNTPACTSEGTIASGAITSSSLVGPLAGHSLADLIVAMTAGGTYANVHSQEFPNGEIRGQVVLVGVAEVEQNNGGDNNQGNDNSGNGNNDDHQGENDDHQGDQD